jgi:hypothetical protein
LVEVFVILLFALGWGVVGLARSLDKEAGHRAQRR